MYRERNADGSGRGLRTPKASGHVQDVVGQSEVISVILILSLSLISIGMITGFSAPVFSDSINNIESKTGERGLESLDSAVSGYSKSSEGGSFRINLGGNKMSAELDSVYLNITQQYTGGTWNNRSIYEGNISRLEYTGEDSIISYEGGGLMKKPEGSEASTVLSRPAIEMGNGGVSITVYNITTESSISGDSVSIAPVVKKSTIYPNESYSQPGEEGFDNPVRNGTIYLTVETEYYQAWEDFLRNSVYAEVVQVDAGEKSVKARLIDTEALNEITTSGVSSRRYDPVEDPFTGDFRQGVSYPTVEDWISDVVDYSRGNPSVDNISACEPNCLPSGKKVYYSDDDYVLDNVEVNTNGGKVYLVVNGVATIEEVKATGDPSNSLNILATDGFVFNDNYVVEDLNNPNMPDRFVMYPSPESNIWFRGGGNGQGVMYAPGSEVDLGGMENSDWRGSFVAQSISTTGIGPNADINLGTGSVSINPEKSDKSLHITEKNITELR